MVGVYVSSSPSKPFAFPRSYVKGFQIHDEGTSLTISGSEIWSNIPGIPGYRNVYEIRPVVLPWSSNRYTLNYVVLNCWWRTNASPSQHPQAYAVDYIYDPIDKAFWIRIRNPAVVGIRKILTAPPPAPGYWLPSWFP